MIIDRIGGDVDTPNDREQDDWDIVKALPTPKLDHPTIVDMFTYLLEVEGHRSIDPDKCNKYGKAIMPNVWCAVGGGRYRIQCPSCTALRLHANSNS